MRRGMTMEPIVQRQRYTLVLPRFAACILFLSIETRLADRTAKGSKMTNNERDGEYAPVGEERSADVTFSLEEIASAFDVDPGRVRQALSGEFGSDDIRIDSRQAQHLTEVLLGDQPQDHQMAALIKLGAYTPRPDHVEGLGEKDPAEESDKLKGDTSDLEYDPQP